MSDNDEHVSEEESQDDVEEPVEQGEPAAEESAAAEPADEAPRELTPEDEAKLAELDAALEKFEGQKRWSDVIKTTLAKAELVVDLEQKVALFADAGRLYIERSSNQAEAIKAYSMVLELDPGNLEAIEHLKEMYEKRRDWERLVGVMRAECNLLDESDQPMRLVEIAQLATEKLRKPAICIELWQDVLSSDPENHEGLTALSNLYERAREWEPLAAVLDTLSTQMSGEAELVQLLTKLGSVYADKVHDDEGAVRAYQRLLELKPDDRRAQEQLKKRYVALKSWDDLEGFYAATEKWDELIRTLERAADTQGTEPDESVALLFRVARLWQEKNQKPDRAARALEKIISIDAANQDAALQLIPIYEAAGDAKKLVSVYGVRLGALEDPSERVMLLRETGLLHEEKLRNPKQAFESFIEAFAVDPSQEVLRDDLERLAGKVKDWDRLFAAYAEAIDATDQPDDAHDLRLHYGRVLIQAERIDEAITQFRAVYDDRTEDAVAIAALDELYRQVGNHGALLSVLQRRSELESDTDVRKQLAYEMAHLYQDALQDPDQAIEAYRAIPLEFGESETDAYAALDVLYEQRERWDDLAQALEHRIDLGPGSDEELAALKFRLAGTQLSHLGAREAAVDGYREVLMLLPEHEGALHALEGLLVDGELGGRAAAIVEPIYETKGDWAKLVDALEVSVRFMEDPQDQIDAITKMGEIYADQLGNPAGAFDVYCRAMKAAPENPGIVARLEGLAREQERLPDMVTLLGSLASEADDPTLARGLLIKAASLQDEDLGDVDAAVASYSKALELDEADAEVLASLEALFRRTERWREVIEVLRKRALNATDPQEQEDTLTQMASIHSEMLEEPDAAIRVFGEILELDPTSGNALAALDGLFERQEMWSELADNVGRQLSLAEDEDQRIALMVKLASLRESRMGATDSAIEMYRDVLDREPQQAEALASLERLIAEPAHQMKIAEVLEPLYMSSGEHQKLVGVHEIQVAASESADQRVELLRRMAGLHENDLQDLASAFQCFARALSEDPGNPDISDELDRLAAGTDGWEALAQVYEQRVQALEDRALAASLHAKAAQIREDQLGDQPAAIAHYRRVMELDEHNLDAAVALERLYTASEQYEELAKIYMAKAPLLDDPESQKEHYFKAGALYEEILERPEEAIVVYRLLLGNEPDDLGALDKLIELYLRLQQWENLLEIYSQKADIVDDPDQKKALFAHVGAVYEHELGQREKAIDTYQRVLEIDPEDLEALGRLDALYGAMEAWDEQLAILEREADTTMEPVDALGFRYRIGELFETRLADAFRAVEMYRDILDNEPEHAQTLAALERMIAAGQEPVAAATVLEPIYRGAVESAKLVGVLEVLVRHDEDPIRQVELLHQIAELHEVHLDQPREAFSAYSRALPGDNANDTTLASMERFADQLDAWGELAASYDAEIRKLQEESPDDAVDLALRLAQIFEVQTGDVENAITRYEIVFAADPGHVQTLEALDRLYEATERWDALTPILTQEIEIAGSPDDVLSLQYRLGRLRQERLGDLSGAVEQYRDILGAAPEHEEALAALEGIFAAGHLLTEIGEVIEPLYRMQEEWNKLIGVHEAQLMSQSDKDERIMMMHRIAEIAEERALDDEAAFTWMQRAFMEDPLHDHSCDEVERLAAGLDGWAILANTYAGTLGQEGAAEMRVAVGKRAARVYEEELADVVRAESTYRYVLDIDDRDEDVLSALDRIYTDNGAGEALTHVLRKRVSASEDAMDKVQFAHRLGTVLFNDVGRIDEATDVYSNILAELDAEHEETIHALQNVYTLTENWPKLFATYQRELEIAVGDSVQAETLGRMAHLAATKLDDVDGAVDLLKRVLDLLGEEPAALNALGNLYARQDNWADLVDVLEREVAVSDDDEIRVKIYADLGTIWYERLQRDRNALESWERVLDIEPGSTDALFAIASIHRAAESGSDLVDTLHRVVDVGTATLDEARLEGVYMELGALYDQQLQQPSDAVEQYRSALDLNPRNFGALDALETIHSGQDQWEECIEVKQRRADALEEPPLKIEVLLDIAKMWEEKLEDRDAGRSAFEQVLEADPLHEFAFDQIQALHREQERFEELIDVYLTRVESTEEAGDRVAILTKVASVYEKDLDDKNQAFDALLFAWQQDFTDNDCAEELERLTGLTQRWNEVLTTANEALQATPEDETEVRHAICLKCARWYGREGHPEYAIPFLQQVLAVDPINRPAMAQMAELYRATHEWQTYGQVLGKLAEMTEAPDEKADVFVKLGELNEEQFGAAEQAISHFKDALAAVPAHLPALRALERMYRKREEWTELLDVLKKKITAIDDPEQELAAKLELAEAYEDRVADKTLAIQHYKQVLETDPENSQGLKGLERLYAQQEMWQELLGVLEKQLDLASSDRDQVVLLSRIAGMWEEEFAEPVKAAERLEQVVDIDPTRAEALQGLARLYRAQQKWGELIQTMERHVEVSADRTERGELFTSIGNVYRDELKDSDQAVEAFLNVVSIDEDNVPAQLALSALYEQREEYSLALDTMEKLTVLVEDDEQRVGLLFRMGTLFDKELGDRVTAIDHFQRATVIDDKHLPSLHSMRDIHVEEGDYNAAATVLEQAAEVEEDPRRNAVLRVDLGRIYQSHLEEPERAVESYEEAYKLDADSTDAALPLVDEYTKQERWSDAAPLLQMLVRNAAVFETEEQHRLWFMYGNVSDHTDDDATAIQAYAEAFALDSQDLPSLMGLAAAYYRGKDWANAFKFYQMVLVHHRDELGGEETTETFYRLGVVKREQGENRKALNMFDKALEEDGLHRPTLDALVDLYTEQGDWEQVVHYLKRVLDATDSEQETFELYARIGDIWQDKLKNPASAIEAYTEASALRPSDHKMLHKLLGLYQSTGQWEPAIEIIDKVSELDGREETQAKYAYTVGVVLRDELKDPDRALERFNKALDLHSEGQLKAFEAINKILTQRKDWKQLERAFRKMLHRLSGGGDTALEFNLWHNLGVIYRDRQQSHESAAEAFAMASRLQPDNMEEHVILAELYAVIPDRVQDAIDEQQILLKNDPFRVDSYRSLYKLYFNARQYDRSWCVAATLVFLKKAEAEHQQFYDQYKPEGPIRPKSRLNNELWVKELFHPDEDYLVGKLFEAVTPAVLRARAQPDKKWDLKKKQQIPDLMNTTVAFARTFGFVTQVYGLQLTPRLFVCPDRQGGLAHATAIPPATVVGSALLSGVSPLDVIFVVGKHLSYYRGEHYIRTMFQTRDEMKLVLLAAMKIAGMTINDPAVDQWATELRSRMQPGDMELLNKIGKRFVDAGARTDIKRWMRTVELTGCRAGFLMCNDLEIASRMIQAEPPMGADDMTPKEKVKELVLFSVSESYFRLREALGIQIGAG